MNLVINDTIYKVYLLTTDIGEVEFVFSGENYSDIMHNLVLINLHICEYVYKKKIKKIMNR